MAEYPTSNVISYAETRGTLRLQRSSLLENASLLLFETPRTKRIICGQNQGRVLTKWTFLLCRHGYCTIKYDKVGFAVLSKSTDTKDP